MEYRRKLPHFDHPGHTFFVTWRLQGSIAKSVAQELLAARSASIAAIEATAAQPAYKKEEITKIERRYFKRFDGVLDSATFGDAYLTNPSCMQILQEVLQEDNGVYYHLIAYCIMSNHVHALLDTSVQIQEGERWGGVPDDYKPLFRIMQRIKSKSAIGLNRMRGTQGQPVWEKETYDRYMRDEAHSDRTIEYILNNPVKAGLVKKWQDWPGNYYCPR